MKYLLILKILPKTLFRGSETEIFTLKALTGTRLCFWNIIPEVALDICIYTNFPVFSEGWTLEKSTNGSRPRNYDAASGTILQISFHFSWKQAKFIKLFFSSTRQPKNLKKPAAHRHNAQIQLYRPSKKYSYRSPFK
jgi:hypothetical protein